GHQAMPAAHQLERALALADPARPEEQHADASDVDERSVGPRRHANLTSSSSMARQTSSRLPASRRRLRKLASRTNRAIRASAFRCWPPEFSGTTSRKKRWVG